MILATDVRDDLGDDLGHLVWHSGYPNFRGDIARRHNILQVVSMAITTMSRLQVTFYRHRTRPGVIAVSPVSTNLVFPEPDDWELERQDIINTDRVEPGTEIAAWLEAFRLLGYCVLEPSGPGLAKSGDADPRASAKAALIRLPARRHGRSQACRDALASIMS